MNLTKILLSVCTILLFIITCAYNITPDFSKCMKTNRVHSSTEKNNPRQVKQNPTISTDTSLESQSLLHNPPFSNSAKIPYYKSPLHKSKRKIEGRSWRPKRSSSLTNAGHDIINPPNTTEKGIQHLAAMQPKDKLRFTFVKAPDGETIIVNTECWMIFQQLQNELSNIIYQLMYRFETYGIDQKELNDLNNDLVKYSFGSSFRLISKMTKRDIQCIKRYESVYCNIKEIVIKQSEIIIKLAKLLDSYERYKVTNEVLLQFKLLDGLLSEDILNCKKEHAERSETVILRTNRLLVLYISIIHMSYMSLFY